VGVQDRATKVNAIEREEDTMKTWHVIVLAASIIVASIGGVLVRGLCDRYQLTAQAADLAYRVDKLTGKVAAVWMENNEPRIVEEK
jgi:uncharacterized membrane protein